MRKKRDLERQMEVGGRERGRIFKEKENVYLGEHSVWRLLWVWEVENCFVPVTHTETDSGQVSGKNVGIRLLKDISL